MIDPLLLKALEGLGIPLDDAQCAALAGHLAMIRQYQASISLVSHGDLAALEERHLFDSLALAPWVRWVAQQSDSTANPRPLHLDIGSGGGFPAIPLAVALPAHDFVLVERSQKKADFLYLVVATLRLKNVQVVAGQFPNDVFDLVPTTITARAVENPNRVWRGILAWMPDESSFLGQFAGLEPELQDGTFEDTAIPERLAVLAPWQRGALHLYRSAKAED